MDDSTKIGNAADQPAASAAPCLSADGTKVAFVSAATNIAPAKTDSSQQVFVKNLTTGVVTLASTNSANVESNGDPAGEIGCSDDLTKVAFQSNATNLSPDRPSCDAVQGTRCDDNDVFVRDLVGGGVTLASTNVAHVRADSGSSSASMSGDGNRVAFRRRRATSTRLTPTTTPTSS